MNGKDKLGEELHMTQNEEPSKLMVTGWRIGVASMIVLFSILMSREPEAESPISLASFPSMKLASAPVSRMSCKDLTGFAFEFRNSLPSAKGSGSISTHSKLLYLSVVDPGMTSSQCDPLSHSVFLLSDPRFLPTI
ncbi:hypothetical protein DSO57_1033722 [Entomophthora muscae]|uniref:Uncharacterized protein n=1 Tax=Entomophthora muscae TaxID=34485 RepID=A0ACC2SNY0_9FUNG|nr:hypothetical protein DSO57_1033722 [Entomophthora muscae]